MKSWADPGFLKRGGPKITEEKALALATAKPLTHLLVFEMKNYSTEALSTNLMHHNLLCTELNII